MLPAERKRQAGASGAGAVLQQAQPTAWPRLQCHACAASRRPHVQGPSFPHPSTAHPRNRPEQVPSLCPRLSPPPKHPPGTRSSSLITSSSRWICRRRGMHVAGTSEEEGSAPVGQQARRAQARPTRAPAPSPALHTQSASNNCPRDEAHLADGLALDGQGVAQQRLCVGDGAAADAGVRGQQRGVWRGARHQRGRGSTQQRVAQHAAQLFQLQSGRGVGIKEWQRELQRG